MALIRIFSDLHLEFSLGNLEKCIDLYKGCGSRTKYTILAGDITNFREKEKILTKVSEELKNYTDNIIYVLGNHEHYELGQKNITESMEEYRSLCKKLDITLLENESIETEDFTFYGATMWTDIDQNAYNAMNDQHSFRCRQDLVDIHKNSVKSLHEFLDNYSSSMNSKPLVVITHHLPSFSLIDEKYRNYSFINSGFASSLDHLIRDPVRYWIYGHTHTASNSEINGVRMICNPGGYPREYNVLKDFVI